MQTEQRVHIFWMNPDTGLFHFGKGTFTEDEVNTIVRLLPPEDQVIRIVWCEPHEYIAHQKRRDSGNFEPENEPKENFNLTSNGNLN